MTGFLCLIVLIFTTALFRSAGKYSDTKGYALKMPQTILGVVVFSFLVGLRYNPVVDPDFLGYWGVAEYGSSFYEYDRIEILPRLLADVVHLFHWPPSAWFILMGGILAFFSLFAACRIRNRFMPIVFYGLMLLYLSFDMNVMRQGVAISVFLCAVTYIGERNWKKYLLFVALAYCFHKSSIIWSVSYFLTFLNWREKPLRYIVVIVLCSALAFKAFDYVLQNFGFVFTLLGKEQITNMADLDLMMMDKKGSGLGVIIRYIRWGVLLYFIPKIAKNSEDHGLFCIFILFVIGVVMDIFSMYSIILSRIAFYPQITELLLYPYVFIYKKSTLIKFIAIFQVLFLTYVLYGYLDKWQFVI